MALALSAAAVAAPVAEAAFPGSNGRIAFTRDHPVDGQDIWAMDATGLNQLQLTTGGGQDVNPAFSPDGTKIAFASERAGNREIYVMNADGSGQTRLTNDPALDDNPTFSGNGSKIAFESNRDGNIEIYVMRVDGTGSTVNVTNNAGADEDPAFSPSGQKIAFRSTRDRAAGDIYTVNADGTAIRRLTEGITAHRDPHYSPDGARLAYTRGDPGSAGNVRIVNSADGSGETSPTQTSYPSDTREPAFSPNGQEIAYARKGGTFDPPSSSYDIYTMTDSGASKTDRSLNPALDDRTPDWGPQPGTTPARPSASVADASVTENNAGEIDATVTVSLSAASATEVEVDFATADDSAQAPSDYTAAAGTLVFDPGQTTRTVTVKVKGDTEPEPDERFFVNLTGARGATINDGQAAVTIVDNDAPTAAPQLSIDDVSVTEGNSGETDATFTVTLSAASTDGVSASFETADDSATSPADYTQLNGTVTFAPGQTSSTVTVKVKGDTIDEVDERFLVNLSSPSGATFADSQGAATITDDDTAGISINDQSVAEGDTNALVDALFTVSLSATSSRRVSVGFATEDDTATAPADYLQTTGTVTFEPGETTKNVAVRVKGDASDEPDERFFVDLSAPVAAPIARGRGTGTIVDDDDPPAAIPGASIDDVSVPEGNSGDVDATFEVSLSGPTTQEVKIDFATADDSASAPADYSAQSGTLTFTPGQTTKAVTVKVAGDVLDEVDERLLVNLSNARGSTLTDGQGAATIVDDDEPPAVAVSDVTVTEGNAGERPANFEVSLSSASGRLVRVDLQTANGSASAPADYSSATPRLTFLPGELSKTVAVGVRGDTLDEPHETFLANLSNPQSATLADGQGIGTITDDDAPGAAAAPRATPAPAARSRRCANRRSVRRGASRAARRRLVRLTGGSLGDALFGSRGREILRGLGGDDCLYGRGGNDRLSGGSGNDRLSGGSGKDRLSGGSGNDRLSGGSGKDRLNGGGGNDVINSADGRAERVNCGRGRDRVRADRADRLIGCERKRFSRRTRRR